MQAKGVTAFLTELGDGTLLGPGGLWQRSLAGQENTISMQHNWLSTLQRERDTAQTERANALQESQQHAAEIMRIKADNAAEIKRITDLHSRVQADNAKEIERITNLHSHLDQEKKSLTSELQPLRQEMANFKTQLDKAESSITIRETCIQTMKTEKKNLKKTIKHLNEQIATIKNQMPEVVESFKDVASQALRQTTRLSHDAEWPTDRFSDTTPLWLLNQLRQTNKRLWDQYSKALLRLMGWTAGEREHKQLGGAVARAFAILGIQHPDAAHGAFDVCGMVTAMTHHEPAVVVLNQGIQTNASLQKGMRRALFPPDPKAYERIAEAALKVGANKRQAQLISKASSRDAKFSMVEYFKATKRIKTCVADATGVHITGSRGALCSFFRSMSTDLSASKITVYRCPFFCLFCLPDCLSFSSVCLSLCMSGCVCLCVC